MTARNPLVLVGGALVELPAADTLNGYQVVLVSGTNIKTVNGVSILGSGDLVVSGGTGTVSNLKPFFWQGS